MEKERHTNTKAGLAKESPSLLGMLPPFFANSFNLDITCNPFCSYSALHILFPYYDPHSANDFSIGNISRFDLCSLQSMVLMGRRTRAREPNDIRILLENEREEEVLEKDNCKRQLVWQCAASRRAHKYGGWKMYEY